MAGINIDANLDGRNFIKSVDNMADALSDLEDEVKQVQKDGDQSLEKLEKSFAEVAKASRDAGDDVKKGLGKGTRDASDDAQEGLKDFKQEANSTAKESAASFDGSAESIVDSFQEIAANAFEGFGPAGALAGLAVAAGIGVATAEFTKTQEQAQLAKERVNEFGLAIIESGSDVAGMEQVNEQLRLIVTNADEAPKKLEDIQKLIQKYPQLAGDVGKLAMAYAGNSDAIEDVTKQLELAIEAEKEKNYTTAEGARQSDKRVSAYQAEIDKLESIQEETTAAKEIEASWLASGGAEIVAKADAISQINDAYDDAVFSVDNFKNAETGIYDLNAYAASIEERERLLLEYQSSLAESGLTTGQKAALNEMGVEQANAILKGLKDPNTSQATKDTIKKGLETASKEGSGVATAEMKKAFQTPIEAKIQAKLDYESAQEASRAIDRAVRDRTIRINVQAYDRNGRRVD